MRSVRLIALRPSRAATHRLRAWASPVSALVLTLFLGFVLPTNARTSLASFLEHSLFFPYRAAIGWGPRSLLAERALVAHEAVRADAATREGAARETSAENEHLRRLLGLGRRSEARLVPAVVVARGRGRLGDVLTARYEGAERLELGLPVVVPEGLLGRIAAIDGQLIRVEGLANPNVAVSVQDQRSREEGIAKWIPGGRWPLWVQGAPSQADWQGGDRVVTSGLGAVFPKGLLVGYVMGAQAEEMGRLRRIGLRPAASFARAEVVFFLLGDGKPTYPPVTRGPGADPDEAGWTALYPIDPERELSRLEMGEAERFRSGPVPSP